MKLFSETMPEEHTWKKDLGSYPEECGEFHNKNIQLFFFTLSSPQSSLPYDTVILLSTVN